MKRKIFPLLAVLALGAVFAADASAHEKKYSTSTTFFKEVQPGGQYAVYYGTVTSSSSRCVGGRTVTLGGDGGSLTSAVTDDAGNWRTAVTFNDSSAGVGVLQKKIKRNDKHKHICKQFSFIP